MVGRSENRSGLAHPRTSRPVLPRNGGHRGAHGGEQPGAGPRGDGLRLRTVGSAEPFCQDQAAQERQPPPVGYLQAHDLARLLDFLNQQQATYGESLTYHLAAALFYTCSRYSEIANLRWNDCLLDGSGRMVALRIKGKGSVHSTLPVNAILSEVFGRMAHHPGAAPRHEGVRRAGAQVLPQRVHLAGPGGEPYTNQSFNAHLEPRLQGPAAANGPDRPRATDSAATILLNDQGKNLREVQEALRHRDIRTTARYTHVAPEHTRGTMDALGGSLPAFEWTQNRNGRKPRKIMTSSESAFLERAVVQLLFVSGREFSLENLREKLRELFVHEPDATVRAAASVAGFELLQVLLKTSQKLEKVGLQPISALAASGSPQPRCVPLPCAIISPPSLNKPRGIDARCRGSRRRGRPAEYRRLGGSRVRLHSNNRSPCPRSTVTLLLIGVLSFIGSNTSGWWTVGKLAKPGAPCG